MTANALAKELQSWYAGEREQDVEIFQGDSAFVAQQFELLKRQPGDSIINVIASETERYQTTLESEASWDEYLIFGDPILCITITSKEIADGYREFFETLWNLSSK